MIPEYNLRLTAEELEIVGQGLDELKLRVAKPIADKIQRQYNEQYAEQCRLAKLREPVPYEG